MTSLPEAYVIQMKRLLGEAGFFAYEKALEQSAERALRINLLLCPDGVPPCEIEGLGKPVPWAKGAYFVEGDARPGLSPLHEGGLYYLQEPSALSSAGALDPQPGERVLDLCAAPGGKSTQLAALMGGQGLIVCNEPVPSRAQILSRNIERMGVPHAVVTCAMPAQLAPRFPGYFDRIMVDAPCSGEGMFRRQIEARDEWSENAPRGCAAHPEFSPEGFMLEGLPSGEKGYVHLYPHEIRGEGHFVSLLRKSEDAPCAAQETERKKAPGREKPARGKTPAPKAQPGMELPDVLAPGVRFERLHTTGGCLWALPQGLDDIGRLSGLRVLRTGLLLARQEGKRTEPDHALAMALRPQQAARTAELTQEQAALYQAGETLDLGDLPAGYTLLTHQGVSLGFGKQAGGQMKNHYPKGLRRR